eukprot:symbB.v1.2.018446.t1/scaffold1473.1/size116783/5
MELIERSEPELVADVSPNFSPRSVDPKSIQAEGPRISPRDPARRKEEGQLLAVWPPIRREESWELQQLRAECAKLMRKHQEDRQNLEDVTCTVADVRQHVEQLRHRIELQDFLLMLCKRKMKNIGYMRSRYRYTVYTFHA